MTTEEFTERLEDELRRRRAQFHVRDVQAFVEQHWARIVQDPDAARWAGKFLDAGLGSVTV